MKVLIILSSTFKGGSEQVALSFIQECKKIPENKYFIILRNNLLSQICTESFNDNFSFYELEKRPAEGFQSFLSARKAYKQTEDAFNPDCIISTGGHFYWHSNTPVVTGFNIPHYIYPESPYFKFQSYRNKLYFKFKKFIHYYYYKRANAFIVQTDDIKKRLERQFPGKPVYHVSNTISSHFFNPVELPEKLPLRKPNELRFLTLSAYYAHKNLEIIKDVIEELINRQFKFVKFVLSLPDDDFNAIFNSKYQAYIYNVGPVPAKECPALYKECDFMFLPTLLECFSASYAEAMAMGKPILTSDLGFAHTVCKDAAIYFDPLDAKDITRKMLDLAQDKKKQNQLTARGQEIVKEFNTPEQRARKFLEICEEVSGN